MTTVRNYVTHFKRNYKGCLIPVIFIYLTVIFFYFIRGSHQPSKDNKPFKSADDVIIIQSDGELLEEIKAKFVHPRPNFGLNISGSVHTGQIGQAEEIFQYFNGKKNGYFVEAGAWDGEYLSNTLFLEVNSSWTGLLVEPNTGAHSLLMSRHRSAVSINSCLSVQDSPNTVEFDAADVFGGINQDMDKVNNNHLAKMRDSIPDNMRSRYELRCYPLFSLLLALGNPRVDFLSLDIEGAELAVLRTVPWDKVDIELVMVEINHSDKAELDRTMSAAGYEVYKNLKKQDVIYRRVR